MVTMAQVAEVAAAGEFGGGDDAGDGLRLLDHFGRELVRQVVLADDDFDVHAEIVGVAEDLDHAADRSGAALGVLEQLDVDDHAVEFFDRGDLRGGSTPMRSGLRRGGRNLHAVGDLDPLLQALVVRDHVSAAAADAELADHGGVGALQDLDDFAVGAAAGLDAGDADHHAVAVHGLLRPNRAE